MKSSNKKFLHFIAALMILVFHLWMPVTGTAIENYIIKVGYVGVDIFFFTSAYSLADKDIDYVSLLKNRFATLYGKFALFAIVAAIYKSMKILRVIKILSFVELFEKGGGAFLWFVPAILLFYIFYPLFLKWQFKYKVIVVAIVWFVLSVVLSVVVGYTDIFIFTNRIPVMLVGYLLKKHKLPEWALYICLPVGIILMYFYGYKYKLNVPFKDIYFVLGIFAVLGLYGISMHIKSSRVWDILSMGTLELYGLQMIFGPKAVTTIYKATDNILLTNVIMIIIFWVIAVGVSELWSLVFSRIASFGKKQ